MPAKGPLPVVLLTLGRLPKALDLARGFADLGCRVIVADPYRWHLCRVSRSVSRCYRVAPPATRQAQYLDDLVTIVAKEGVNLVVPVSEETMHVAQLAGRLPPAVRLYTMSPEFVLTLHSKRRFPDLVTGWGLQVPPTYPADSAAAAELIAAHDVVIKPEYSCSGRGVRFLSRGTALPDCAEPMVVQRRVDGSALSTFSIARHGEVVVTVVYRGTMMSGTVAVCFERVQESDSIRRWIRDFVSKTTYDGFVSFDFIEDEAGVPWAIECNPRVTSGIHFLDSAAVAEVIVRNRVERVPPFRSERRMQQFFPALTVTQGSVLSGDFRKNVMTLARSTDVSWRLSDPLPLVTLPLTSVGILARTIWEKKTFGEVATSDLHWMD